MILPALLVVILYPPSFTEDPAGPVVSGCTSMVTGVCRLNPERHQLTLFWRPTFEQSLTVRLDGEMITTDEVIIGDGVRAQLEIPPGHHVLTAVWRNGWETPQRFPFEWRLVEDDAELLPAQRVVSENKPDAPLLRREFARLQQVSTRDEVRGRALKLLGRLARRLEDRERAVALWRTAIPFLQRAEEWSELVEVYQALGHTLDEPTQARAFFAAAAELLHFHPAGMPTQYKLAADLYDEAGDPRSARAAAERCQEWAEYLDQPRVLAECLQILAEHDALQGRSRDALARFEEVASLVPRVDVCYGATLDNNAGWAHLRFGEMGGDVEHFRRAQDLFEGAERVWGHSPCYRNSSLTNVRINLALVALALGDADRAAYSLPDAEEAGELEPDQRAWYDLAERRIALMRGVAAADLDLARLADDDGVIFEVRWLASLVLARWSVDTGNKVDAERWFLTAGQMLDRWVMLQPGDLERSFVATDIRAMESDYVDFLTTADRLDEASCVARRAQTRRHHALPLFDASALMPARQRYEQLRPEIAALQRRLDQATNEGDKKRLRSTLAVRQRELSLTYEETLTKVRGSTAPACADLSPPGDDEVLLIYHPLPKGRWLRLALTSEEIVGERFEHADLVGGPDEWYDALLGPFEEIIADHSRVRIIASGIIFQIPIHALVADSFGVPSAAPLAVVWSLDLPPTSLPRALPRSAVLLIGDTMGLDYAKKEADEVTRALTDAEWEVRVLQDADAFDDLLDDPWRRELLYAVGHGSSDGVLELPRARSLSGVDITQMRAPPRAAILSACYAGLAGTAPPDDNAAPGNCAKTPLRSLTLSMLPDGTEGGLGEAGALLLRGTEVVVAPQGPICDADARELLGSIFDELTTETQPDYATLVGATQARLAYEPSHDSWRFRVMIRG